MTGLHAVRSGIRMVQNHPELVKWYLHNKARTLGLPLEQHAGEGWSKQPLGITFKPTLSCNLRCRMCSFVANGAVFTNPKDSLPREVWQRVVDDVRAWNPYIWFTGGEPTLYPDFVELVAYIKQAGLLTGVTTNGTTLKRRAEELLEHPLDMMVISIDGLGAVHNLVRGHDRAFERTTEGVKELQELKRRKGLHKPAIVVNCAMTPDNYERVPEMVGVAQELGADALNIQHLWQLTAPMVQAHNLKWGDEHCVSYDDCGGMAPKPMDVERVIEVVHEVKALDARIPVLFHPELTDEEIRIYYREPEQFVRRRPAACAWLNTDILPNGDVSPCYDVVCGNIQEQRFTDIWNAYAFRRHRQRLSEEGDLPICARCCAYWRRD